MAVDQTTLQPIKPFMGEGGTSKTGSPTLTAHATADAEYVVGDILIMTSGRAVVDNTNPTASAVIGVCAEDYTAPNPVGSNDKVRYWANTPGRIWEGNWANATGAADDTFTIATDNNVTTAINESVAGGTPVVDSGGTAQSNIRVIDVPPYQIRGANFVDGSSGTTNPRVLFVFTDSLLSSSS